MSVVPLRRPCSACGHVYSLAYLEWCSERGTWECDDCARVRAWSEDRREPALNPDR